MTDTSFPPIPDRLSKWRSEGQLVELWGNQIWYHDKGPKTEDAVFIIHGYPGSSWDFQDVVAHIGPGTRTVVMDMLGFGLSEKPLDGDYQAHYTLQRQADLYIALATHLGLKSVLLVAHDMGQSVGLELMARLEEDRLPFRIRHAILLDGSTLVDMIKPTKGQLAALAAPSTALPEDQPWESITAWFPGAFSKETEQRADYDEVITCMSHQIDENHGSRVIGPIVHYLKERKETFDRWSRTMFQFKKAPMTVIWGEQDPVAVIAMADRFKRERPVTDIYKYPDCAHWPSIELPERIGDAIIARLGSVKAPRISLWSAARIRQRHERGVFTMSILRTASIALSLAVCMPAFAQDAGTVRGDEINEILGSGPYSPYAERTYPTRPLFGDTHLHTGFSMDAGVWGATLTPVDAYRFARGEEVLSSTGQQVKLSRPLDFLIVTDHSDNMGFATDLIAGDTDLLSQPKGREWYDLINSGKGGDAALDMIGLFSQGKFPPELLYAPGTRPYRDAWEFTVDAAETYNDPGRFTALIGYEWTSLVEGGNMHRNVIFRDGKDLAMQMVPYTQSPPAGSNNPVDLWNWMQLYEDTTGGSVLAIPHNGNLSNGIMFPVESAYTGEAIDESYAATRAKWERLYEVAQSKGDAEAHPLLSPTDEFADFETWDKGNLDASAVKTPDMLEHEYARPALKNGLALEQSLGTNPYKFGLIGSSDAHTGLAAMAEENFFGKTVLQEPSPERMTGIFMQNDALGIKIVDWEVSAAGYAAVWAEDNTRKAIWDAMHRRETYATTGPRMAVRFFGGWDFTEDDSASREPARVGYQKGVPMGGDLPARPEDAASPTFLVAALKDGLNANLDRIQIIKGWMGTDGALNEQVYNVVWGGDRALDPDGNLPPVGSTVDIDSATWTNTIGASELVGTWSDPAFDPAQRAFYYARVLQIPTPRWTAYDAYRFGIEAPGDARMTIVERAYTSPIWYTPAE